MLSDYPPIPSSLDFAAAAALPTAVETAARALDQLGVKTGSTVPINGASGTVGSAAVQLAVARDARVIRTGSPATYDFLRSLGAQPIAYGDGMTERAHALAPGGVDLALDVAGSGVLPELVELAGDPEHVITIADFAGAQQHGVRFSRGDSPRAIYALAQIGDLIESGQFTLPVGQTFLHSCWATSQKHTAPATRVTWAESSCCWSTEQSVAPRMAAARSSLRPPITDQCFRRDPAARRSSHRRVMSAAPSGSPSISSIASRNGWMSERPDGAIQARLGARSVRPQPNVDCDSLGAP